MSDDSKVTNEPQNETASARPESARAAQAEDPAAVHYRWIQRQRQLAKSEVIDPNTGTNLMQDYNALSDSERATAASLYGKE